MKARNWINQQWDNQGRRELCNLLAITRFWLNMTVWKKEIHTNEYVSVFAQCFDVTVYPYLKLWFNVIQYHFKVVLLSYWQNSNLNNLVEVHFFSFCKQRVGHHSVISFTSSFSHLSVHRSSQLNSKLKNEENTPHSQFIRTAQPYKRKVLTFISICVPYVILSFVSLKGSVVGWHSLISTTPADGEGFLMTFQC